MEVIQRAQFLRKIHLFHELKDDQLPAIAEKITEVSFPAETVIFKQGSEADSFYFVFRGKVRIVRKKEDQKEELATLVVGDYFGEMAMVAKQLRTATVEAVQDSVCFRLTKDDFAEMLQKYPSIKLNLEVAIESRKLARKMQFKWFHSDEFVYFLARKHPLVLAQALVAPIFFVIVPIFLFLWSITTGAVSPAAFGGVILAGLLAWVAWTVVDWGNDYYLVTNQRVVWVEKVIGMYDSRTEAPLSMILSVGVETDMTGRMFDYGTVQVRTFVGSIPFRTVNHPNQAAYMVEEYWKRTQQTSIVAEKEAFKDALRERLGLLKPSGPADGKAAPAANAKKAVPWKLVGGNLFKLRFDEGSTITYRKHWIVLLRQVGMPSLTILLMIWLTIARLNYLARSPDQSFIQTMADGSRGVDTIAVSLPLLLIPLAVWWGWQYVDWRNDIFCVTPDQIMDLDRTPFGKQEQRTAPLDNILSTRYERLGLGGYLFNYGTVYISVGIDELAFDDVLDPASVQSDIDRRRMSRMASKKQAEIAAERNRLVDWMASYYQNITEIQKELDARDAAQKSG